ncbi:MAG: N-acetylmuramoyl-L-alanine amidase [Crocinitomicaceae bacterium]|nr:N-acetylmuramoyl-L-alanine amidase [Crocinitomicaceae bacterium]
MSVSFVSLSQRSKNALPTIKTVCIDAGHGGKDPGCHGSSANEKTVCLSMALKLGAKIKESFPNVNVVYTRDSDVFVELDDRAKIANKHKADLFICIHANSASPAAYGTETFVLGLHRTESQQKIADRENSTIYLESDKGSKYKDFDLSPDAIIARQLQLSIFLDHSINFASKLQQEFKRIGRHDRGVKQAGFIVLYKTTMPSVLIETGFLTNPSDELFLREDASQDRMATSMFEAFRKYKADLEGVDEIKGVKTPNEKQEPVSEQKVEVADTQTTSKVTSVEKKNTIIFKVQIETSDKKLSLNAKKYSGLDVVEVTEGKIYKYLTGGYENDFDEANRLKNELRANGFPNAFVVAYEDGERINIDKGIKLGKKK